MTKFFFVFEKKKTEHDTVIGSVAGSYSYIIDFVQVYLPNIADSFFGWVPGFYDMFQQSFIDECEDHCIGRVQETLRHEYIHAGLTKAGCPPIKQHFAIDQTMEYLK